REDDLRHLAGDRRVGDRRRHGRRRRRADDEERDHDRGADLMFAIGTFADDEREAFPGLLVDGERVLDLSGYGWPTVRPVLAGGDAALHVLEALAEGGTGGSPLTALRVLPPVEPVHILQSGANYREHVLELILAEERERRNMGDDEARAMGERIMDERAA